MYPEEVKLVIKHYPLNSHKFAVKAAKAAMAAFAQEKFWEFHHSLFKNHKAINDAKIQEIAKELNLDMEKFNRDMNSSAIQRLIAKEKRNGRQIGIRGTPTVFVNGKILRNLKLSGFSKIIDKELKKRP